MVAIPAYSRVRQIRPGAENGMPLKLNDLGAIASAVHLVLASSNSRWLAFSLKVLSRSHWEGSGGSVYSYRYRYGGGERDGSL